MLQSQRSLDAWIYWGLVRGVTPAGNPIRVVTAEPGVGIVPTPGDPLWYAGKPPYLGERGGEEVYSFTEHGGMLIIPATQLTIGVLCATVRQVEHAKHTYSLAGYYPPEVAEALIAKHLWHCWERGEQHRRWYHPGGGASCNHPNPGVATRLHQEGDTDGLERYLLGEAEVELQLKPDLLEASRVFRLTPLEVRQAFLQRLRQEFANSLQAKQLLSSWNNRESTARRVPGYHLFLPKGEATEEEYDSRMSSLLKRHRLITGFGGHPRRRNQDRSRFHQEARRLFNQGISTAA